MPTPQRQHDSSLLSAIWETSPTLYLILDTSGIILAANPAAEKRTGRSLEQLRERTPWEAFLHGGHRHEAQKLFGALVQTGIAVETTLPIVDAGGQERRIEWQAMKIGDGRILVLGNDVTKSHVYLQHLHNCEEELERLLTKRINLLEKRNERLNALSVTDHLTGVFNRRYFDNALSQILRQQKRRGDLISLMMCDIDFFKAYNDRLGHIAGDVALKKIADTFKRCAHRENDIIARYGGEEFAIILPGTGREGAEKIAVCIQNNVLSEKISHPDSPVSPYLTVSIGIITVQAASVKDTHTLIELADRQLYKAKGCGRNSIVSSFYQP